MKRFLIITLLTALCCAVTLAASLLGRAGVASASAGDESTGHYIYINFNQDRGQVAVGCNHNSDNSINAGEEVTVVLLPNAGYKVQAAMFGTQTVLSILVNYDENNPLPADGKFIMPDNDVYIRVDFVSETPQQHTVTLQFDSTQGTVSVTGDSNYFYAGETVNLDITPIRGYAADKITSQQDGSSVSVTCSAESFTGVTMPDEDITLTVTFKALQTVTITALAVQAAR